VLSLLPPPALRLVLVQEGVVVLAFWDILGRVTLQGGLVKDESELTALFPGGDVVETDEELGTVVGVSELGMGVDLSELVAVGLLGAAEPAGGF